ncbi:3-oxoacyl-[acyl-carrier-protein] synthase III C-terminal domain-containing protein [Marinobacter salarius]|uniref:3-oxoacyl-[acyl-carrier-protein] synthase III C-terminal domain-containing protein n=1 Tax=Marinobacter salarius TaxID=1420917 RepID=UPI0032EBF12E
MSDRGISAAGAYLPKLRMCRKAIADAHAWAMPSLRGLARGTRSFCNWDEDSITMAVEAVRACLTGSSPESVTSLGFASTTAPFADLQNASIVARAAGLEQTTRTFDNAGSTRAGVSALITALRCPGDGDDLVVAADQRKARPGSIQEMHYGAGAAAIRISQGSDVIARYVGSQSGNNQMIDHYRVTGADHDYYWEERWIRDEGYMKVVPATVTALLERCGIDPSNIEHFILPTYMPRVADTVAKRLGITADAVVDNLAGGVGDTGSPHALLMLISALEQAQPGDLLLVVGFGAGCDAILLEATEAITAYQQKRDKSAFASSLPPVVHYNKLLAFHDNLDLDWGIRSETDNRVALSQLYRAQDQVTGFQAGVCSVCSAVQFPILAACVKCGATEPMGRQSLADQSASVATFASDALQFYPSPPMYWGLVQFDNGARLLMEMVEVDPENFDIGTALRMVYRIKQKDNQRGLHRYFWKATPVERSISV